MPIQPELTGNCPRPIQGLRCKRATASLESIARQDALRSLLAFSELHEQIRNRRLAVGRSADQDLFETERFILDEVLQLICTRAQAITQADGIIIALAAQAAPAEGSTPDPEMVCHATAGPLAVERGVRLIADSRFLQECLETGRILRCDDCDTDPRVENDLAYQIGVRSTCWFHCAEGAIKSASYRRFQLPPEPSLTTTFVVSTSSPNWFWQRSSPKTRIAASTGFPKWQATSSKRSPQ